MTIFARPWFGVIATLLSGALLLASRDIGPYGVLSPLAPVPILVYALAAPRWWTLALAAFVARAIGGLGFAYAYFDVLPKPIVIAWIIGQAIGFTVTVLITRWMAQRSLWMALLAFPLFTTASEFLFGMVSPHGSFGAYGYGLVDILPWLQLASVGGLPALSFAAALCAITLALLIAQPRAWHAPALVGVLTLVIVTVVGEARLQTPAERTTRVALIAHDALGGRAFRNDGAEAGSVAEEYAALVRAEHGGAHYVVLPEKVFNNNPALAPAVEAPLQNAANAIGAPVVAGFDETLADGRRVNSAVIFTPDAETQRYFKRRMIPGLELGYTPGPGDYVDGAIGVAICKDFDFPAMIRGYGQSGVALMLAPAWDFYRDGRLHARMAVVRGVENGFALARAAADGRLTVSDRYGRIVAEAETDREAPTALVADVPLRGGGTLYARVGDVFAWGCVIALCVLIGVRFLLTRRASDPPPA